MKKLWIGTSGYSYKDWPGNFYPKDLKPSGWLEFYASQFPIVELNVTFYRLPKKSVFQGWYKRTPKDFRFFVKGSRYITHIKRLKDPVPSLKYFFSAVNSLKEKTAGVLWQLAPQFKKDAERLEEFLKALKKYNKVPMVFEFRDVSWFDEEITELLKKYGTGYCHADGPDFYREIEIPDIAPFIYVRRHGPNWKVKYWHSYPDEMIREDARKIKKWLDAKKTVFVFYNNDYEGAAIRDARSLCRMLTERTSGEFKKSA